MTPDAPFRPVAGSLSGSVDIVLDGYCDGLHLSLPSEGEPATPSTVDGYQTGCETGSAFGAAKPNVHGSYGVAHGTEILTIPSSGAMTIVRADHTWVHYGQAGDTIVVVNSGTWSRGTPARTATAPTSFERRDGAIDPVGAAGPSGAHRVQAVKDISLDGYCDGFHLVAPSAGLLDRKSIDGHRTGCADEGLIGRRTKLGTDAPASGAPWQQARVVQFHSDEWIQTAIFRDHTWVHYRVIGNLITVLAGGTWSKGTPVARGVASTA